MRGGIRRRRRRGAGIEAPTFGLPVAAAVVVSAAVDKALDIIKMEIIDKIHKHLQKAIRRALLFCSRDDVTVTITNSRNFSYLSFCEVYLNQVLL